MTDVDEVLERYQETLSISIFDKEFAEKMDEIDEMKEFKKEFLPPKTHNGKRANFLCGNSLGLQPASLRSDVNTYLDKWEHEAVEGHFTGNESQP